VRRGGGRLLVGCWGRGSLSDLGEGLCLEYGIGYGVMGVNASKLHIMIRIQMNL
jgi:hypothetical protein